jgi:hypothetical protein
MKIVWTCDFRAVSKAIQETAEPRKFQIPPDLVVKKSSH